MEQEQPICEVLSSAAEAAIESVAVRCRVALPLPCGTARVDAWRGAAKIGNISVDGAIGVAGRSSVFIWHCWLMLWSSSYICCLWTSPCPECVCPEHVHEG